MKITQSELAEKLGMSRTTISNAIYNKGRMSDARRAEILKLVEASGYRPNKLVHSIQTGRTQTVAVFVGLGGSDFFSGIYQGAYPTLTAAGYLPIHFQYTPEVSPADLANELIDRRVDGLLCDQTQASKSFSLAGEFKIRKIPVVMLNQGDPHCKALDFVGTDDALGGTLAAEHLLERGHRRVVQLIRDRGTKGGDEQIQAIRHEAFDRTFEAGGGKVHNIILGGLVAEEVIERLVAAIQSDFKPTCCFAHEHRFAYLTQALRQLGLLLGRDFSALSFGAGRMAAALHLTAIKQPAHDIGVEGAKLLLARMTGSKGKTKQLRLSPSLIDNGSVVAL